MSDSSSSLERFRGNERHRAGGRLPLVVILAGSLIGASLFRQFVISRPGRDAAIGSTAPTTRAANENSPAIGPSEGTFANTRQNFSQFNSYTLGLLLGGLRGPLVMTLWSTSESQKSDRNLDDINTKIELIRLLQPNFDTVHLFQIWNKAYNLSVQMANLPSKYAMILDAIDYARSARAERPDNINIESALGGIYFDKLGNSSEKAYYRERIRDETMAPQGQVRFTFPSSRRDAFVAAALAAGADARRYTLRPESGGDDLLTARLRADYGDRVAKTFAGPDVKSETFAARKPGAGGRTTMRTAADVVLDADGKLLPQFADHDAPMPAIDDVQWRPQNGDLDYLRRFEPYPYGLSPFGLAYDSFKRSLALQETRNQKHAQLSDRVLSSRPALALTEWSNEERERGRRAEMAQFGFSAVPGDESDTPLELPSAGLKPDAVASTPLLEEAIFSYARASQLAAASAEEFRAHMRRYPDDAASYRRHLADIRAFAELTAGDAAYVKLITTSDPAARPAIAREATAAYGRAIEINVRAALAFYIPDELAAVPGIFPRGYGKADVLNSLETPSSFPADQLLPTFTRVTQTIAGNPNLTGGPISELVEYGAYLSRAQTRINSMKGLVGTAMVPTTAPTR